MKGASAFLAAHVNRDSWQTSSRTAVANGRRLDAYLKGRPQTPEPEEGLTADPEEDVRPPQPLRHNPSNKRTPVARPRVGRSTAVAAWRCAMRARPTLANLEETDAQDGVLPERQEETQAQGTAQRIQDMERHSDALTQEIALQEMKWSLSNNAIEHARQEQHALQADVSELSQRAYALRAQIAEMVSLRDDMERQLRAQQDLIARGVASAIQASRLQQELADLERQRDALRKDASQQVAHNREMDARLQALQERLLALQAQLQSSEEAAAASERRRAELQPAVAELERLRPEVERLARERDALAIAIAGLKVQQADLSGQVQQLSAQVEAHEKEKATLEGQVAVLDALRQQVQGLVQREQALRIEMDGLSARRNTLAAEASTLETRNAGLSQKAQDMEHLARALEEKRSSLEEQISRLQAKRQPLDSRALELRGSDPAQRVYDLERLTRELEERRLRLESQVASLEAEASATTAPA